MPRGDCRASAIRRQDGLSVTEMAHWVNPTPPPPPHAEGPRTQRVRGPSGYRD